MESTANKNENEELERDKKEESEHGEQGQGLAEETENEKRGQDMQLTAEKNQSSNEQVEQHHDSPHPMLVEEDTPVPSHSDNPLETITEMTYAEQNIQLESVPHQAPSASVPSDRDKVSFNPLDESVVEHNNGSVKPDTRSSTGLETGFQPGIDVSTGDIGSVKVNIDVSRDQDKGSAITDEKPSTEIKNDKVEDGPENSTDCDKVSVEPDTETSMVLDKGPVEPGTEIYTVRDKKPLELDNERCTEQDNGPVKHDVETLTDHDKGPVELNTETSEERKNGPDKPDTETSEEEDNGPDKLDAKTLTDLDKGPDMPGNETSTEHDKETTKLDAEPGVADIVVEVSDSKVQSDACHETCIYKDILVASEPAANAKKIESFEAPQRKSGDAESASMKHEDSEPGTPHVSSSDVKPEEGKAGDSNNGVHNMNMTPQTSDGVLDSRHSFLLDDITEDSESGTEEEQSAFMKELENFFRERNMEFKPPKFYGEGLNCLKLWRAVIRLGGYDKVTSCKLWRQVGESFRPPKTCTTVSWTFRGFYEKALLDYERHKASSGELNIPIASHSEPMIIDNQASGSGRARRDAAARAMQGWHSRLLGNGEVGDPINKDKNSIPSQKREKQLGSLGLLKRKKPPYMEDAVKAVRTRVSKPQVDVAVVDVGNPADWVKINVQRTKDCFEVYALVPGLLREEVRVQSDPAGRVVISGEPEHPDNPWGVTPFKKVVSLPSRIDPHQTSAVVTLNGQLFVRVPFEQSD